VMSKVRTDSSTEFGSNPILIDRIRIESAAGSNPILIVQIRTALDRAVDFNECVTAFTTSRACTPSYFNGYRVLAALLHGTVVVGVSQTLRR